MKNKKSNKDNLDKPGRAGKFQDKEQRTGKKPFDFRDRRQKGNTRIRRVSRAR